MKKGILLTIAMAMIVAAPAARGQVTIIDQPVSSANTNSYANQVFPDYPTFGIYLADDFVLDQDMDILTIFVPMGAWNPGADLSCVEWISFEIYNNAGGVPDGHPEGGNPPIWSFSAPPSDPAFAFTVGTTGHLTNVELTIPAPPMISAGTYWLVAYPNAAFATCGQYGRNVSDTSNGYVARVINPQNGFGSGWTTWTSIQTAHSISEQDLAFRITGEPAVIPTHTPVPTPTPTPTPDCIRHGDVNLDGILTAADAQLAFYIVLGLYSPTYEEECAADCNGDGTVTAADAQAIFLAVLGMGTCADPL